MYEVVFYEDSNGKSPVYDLIQELDSQAEKGNKKARVLVGKITYCIERLESSGTRAGEKIVKHIDGDLWELRPGDRRIFFFGWNGRYFVLLHAFQKTTQKTPPREIDRARKAMEDWVDRHGE
jgi:phage-related protein